jgi:hypothetical protein
VLLELATSEKGLSHEEAARRLVQTGPNTIKRAGGRSLLKDLAKNLSKESVLKAGLLKNRLILAGIALEAALVIVLTHTPLRAVFNLHPLRPVEWAFLLSFPFIVLLAEEARKALARRS